MQLTIHELLGLKYRSKFDDSNYGYSEILLNITKAFTVESVALAMARAGSGERLRDEIIPARTKVIETKPDDEGLGTYTVTEVAILTFENASPTSIRIYHITFHDMSGWSGRVVQS